MSRSIFLLFTGGRKPLCAVCMSAAHMLYVKVILLYGENSNRCLLKPPLKQSTWAHTCWRLSDLCQLPGIRLGIDMLTDPHVPNLIDGLIDQHRHSFAHIPLFSVFRTAARIAFEKLLTTTSPFSLFVCRLSALVRQL